MSPQTKLEDRMIKQGSNVKFDVKFVFDARSREACVFTYKLATDPIAKSFSMSLTLGRKKGKGKNKSQKDASFNSSQFPGLVPPSSNGVAVSAVGEPTVATIVNGESVIQFTNIIKVDRSPDNDKAFCLMTNDSNMIAFVAKGRKTRDKWVDQLTSCLNRFKVEGRQRGPQAGSLTRGDSIQRTNPSVNGTLGAPVDGMFTRSALTFQHTLNRSRNNGQRTIARSMEYESATLENRDSSSFSVNNPDYQYYIGTRLDATLGRKNGSKRMQNNLTRHREMLRISDRIKKKEDNRTEITFQPPPPPGPPPTPPPISSAQSMGPPISNSMRVDDFVARKIRQDGRASVSKNLVPPPPPLNQKGTAFPALIHSVEKLTKLKTVKGFNELYRKAVMPVLAVDELYQTRDRAKSPKTMAFLKETFYESECLTTLLLESLDDQAVDDLINRMFRLDTIEDEKILEQGKKHDFFYMVEEGTYERVFVDKDDTKESIPTGRGGFFGDTSFKWNGPSHFTVVSKTAGVLWALSRRDYSEVVRDSATRLFKMKLEALLVVHVFRKHLTKEMLGTIANALEFKFVTKGVTLLDFGRTMIDMIYVMQGEVHIFVENKNKPVAKLCKGEWFGEFALFDTVVSEYKLVSASSKTVFLSLNFKEFNGLVGSLREIVGEHFRQQKEKDLKRQIAGSFRQQMEEEYVKQQGVKLTTRGLTILQKIKNDTKIADVEKPYQLESLKTLLDRNQPEEAEAFPGDVISEDSANYSEINENFIEVPSLMPNVRFENIELVSSIGKGSFGEVFHARVKQNTPKEALLLHQDLRKSPRPAKYGPRHFALKVMSRYFIARHGWEDKVDNETSAMAEVSFCCNSEFILKLYHSFCCPRFVYLLIEHGPGADLWILLKSRRSGRFKEYAARFYIACVVNGLDVLHQRKILYRDLKPENLILAADGYLKIADLGLAKKTRRTYTNCGTPDYTAPEILSGKGHDHAVDWWALGVLVYELHVGQTPFYGETTTQIHKNVEHHRSPIEFYDDRQPRKRGPVGYLKGKSVLGGPCKDLIAQLLNPKPTRRLGYTKPGAQGIRNHPYFRKFDWTQLDRKEVNAPFILALEEDEDPDRMPRDEKAQLNLRKQVDRSDWRPKVNTVEKRTPAV